MKVVAFELHAHCHNTLLNKVGVYFSTVLNLYDFFRNNYCAFDLYVYVILIDTTFFII